MSSPSAVLGDRPLHQWKVTELTEELKKRKLTFKGSKDDLVKRLDEALRHERGETEKESDDNGLASNSMQHELPTKKDKEETVPKYQVDTDRAGPSNGISSDFASLKQLCAHEPPKHGNVVGLEEATTTIINYLFEESSSFDVIRIFGMPGVGKTTLASQIFHHPRIRKEFVNIFWVNLSSPSMFLEELVQNLASLKKKNTTRASFKQKEENTTPSMLLEELVDKFQSWKKTTGASLMQKEETTPSMLLEEVVEKFQSLKKTTRESPKIKEETTIEKWLLILDDVLSGEMWKKIHSTLPKGCKVLVTTSFRFFRDSKTSITIRLKCMDENTGWELLYSLINGKLDDKSLPPELERIGKCIVRKCGGIPLAIELISRFLVKKSSSTAGRSAREKIDIKLWEEVADNVKNYLFNTKNPQDMRNSISTRYNMLHPDLRECFLYLGMLPAGIEIPVWKLTELWIAEGLIKPTEEKTVEAVARSIVAELSNRNLVIVKKWHVNYSPKTCSLHEMVREFCINEVTFRNENICHGLTSTTRPDGPNTEPPSIEEIEKCRRLFIHSSSSTVFLDSLLGKQKLPNVHSFLCFNRSDSCASVVLEKQDIQSMTDSFNMLRVLEANAIKFSKFPDKLTRLLQLKYIALSGDKIRTLPTTISKFHRIQTIIVNTMSPTLKVKADVWEMMQLRIFKTKAAIILSKKGSGNGQGAIKLRTLTYLSPKSCTDQVANKAKKLFNLGIRGELARLQDSDFLEKFNDLVTLKLVNDQSIDTGKQRLPGQPLPNRLPPQLKTLVLSATFLNWEKMSILKNLRELVVLILKDNAFMGDCWNCTSSSSDGSFRQLESLSIRKTNLKRWTLASGASTFPKLRTLELKHCQDLEGLPLELGEELPPLGKLAITSVSASAVSSAKEIEQARLKMKRAFRLFIDTVEDNLTNGKIFSIEQHLGGF